MAKKRAEVNKQATQQVLRQDIIDEIAGPSQGTVVIEAPIERIKPNPFQPRVQFDGKLLNELAASIQSQGFYGHLLARRVKKDFEIAYGERRLRAAKKLGLLTIPLVVRDLTNEQMLEVALTENIQRENLTPVEEARAYQKLQELGNSLRQIAARVGKSKTHVGNLLSILKQEDVVQAVQGEGLDLRLAAEIARVETAKHRQKLLKHAARGTLTRHNVKEAIAQDQEKETRRDSQENRNAGDAWDPRTQLAGIHRQLGGMSSRNLHKLSPKVRKEVLKALDEIRKAVEEFRGKLDA